MAGELVATLSNLSQDDPRGNVARIKQAVISQLQQADDSADIKSTDYFNHTFAPDIIMRWRDSGLAERRVYLRPDVRSESLSEDLQWIGELHPLIVPLETNPSAVIERPELDASAASSDTMIAGARTLDEVVQATDGRTGRLMRKAIIRGARGFVTPQQVKLTAERVEGAFDAAQESDENSVRSAIDATEGLLSLGHAGQVTRFLQAVWVASGASAGTFPGASGATGALDTDSLQLLLDTDELDEPAFWTRVARNVDLAKLCALTVAGSNTSFQLLLEEALTRLRAKGLIALTPIGSSSSEDGQPRWSAANGLLHYSSDRFHAIIPPGALSAAVFSGDAAPGEGVAVSTVFSRLSESAAVSGLTFRGQSTSAVHWEAEEPIRSNTDDLLNRLTGSVGSAAQVTSLGLRLAGARDMNVNFLSGRISGRTNTSFYVSELLDVGLSMLLPLGEADRRSIASITKGGDAISTQ